MSQSQADFVAQAVRNRAEMQDAIAVAIDTAATTLVPLFKQDFEHQRWVRGISHSGSIHEVSENIKWIIAGLEEQIKDKLWSDLYQDGAIE